MKVELVSMARCPIVTNFYWYTCIIVRLYNRSPPGLCAQKCNIKFNFGCSTRGVRLLGRNERRACDRMASHLINHLILLLCTLTLHLFRFISRIRALFFQWQQEEKSQQAVNVHLGDPPSIERSHRGGNSGGVSLTGALKLFLHRVSELRLRAHMAGLQPADYSHSLTLCLFVFTLSALSEPERAGLFYNRPSCWINRCHSDSLWAAASTLCLWQRTERPHGQEGRVAGL